jgi:hypothetical protein
VARGPAYDVAAMRKANADAMRTAAAGLEGVAGTPEQSAEALAKLNQAIGRLDLRDERIAEAQEKIGGLEKAADEAAKGPSVEELRALSAELRALAGLVETTRAQPEREELNAKLVNLRNRMTKTLLNTPAAHRALAASVMVVINDQVAETRPSYTAEQRAVLEGRRDLREHEGPRGALPTTRYTPPDAAKAVDPAFKRTPALVALIKESRLLMGHPYENDWWMPLVRGHVRKHDKQLLADIEARNEGYATLRRPGESREGGH